jgi:hypothetical protein
MSQLEDLATIRGYHSSNRNTWAARRAVGERELVPGGQPVCAVRPLPLVLRLCGRHGHDTVDLLEHAVSRLSGAPL